MKKSKLLPLFILTLLTLISCSEQDDELLPEETPTNSNRTELEMIIADREVVEIWGVSTTDCSLISFFAGTKDFEFLEYFVRIQDTYFQYDRLVSFVIEPTVGGNQMLLCFN